MDGRGLTRFCYETLAREVKLEKVPGLDDVGTGEAAQRGRRRRHTGDIGETGLTR